MDCTTAKSQLLDEIYGDLETHDSVELATHLADCASCRDEFATLKAFRTDFTVPAVEVPPGLTERIMARVDEAAAKSPPKLAARIAVPAAPSNRRPWARIVSQAGAWAMRPQTAMAAVFLLMVGSSAWLLREHSRGETSALEENKERGAPLEAPGSESAPADFDPEAARGAHGLAGGNGGAVKSAPVGQAAGLGGDSLAAEGKAKRTQEVVESANDYAPSPASPPARAATASPLARDSLDGDDKKSDREERGKSLGDAPSKSESSGMAAAMASYRARKWDDATAGFDALARQGDKNAELWAARSVREGSGCRTALTRFDHLGGTALGTQPGNDATMDGALCYRSLGQIDASTQRLQRLLAYDGYSAKARAEIETNHRILVARREAQSAAGGGSAAGRASPKAAAKPVEAERSAGPEAQPPQD